MNQHLLTDKKPPWTILVLALLVVVALSAALGFVYFRSEYGPRPSFVLQHAEGIRVQAVRINGQRTSGSRAPTEKTVFYQLRPSDAVDLEVILEDGRTFKAHFSTMGHATRVIRLDKSNLQQTDRGILVLSFDQQQPIKRIRFKKGSTSIIYESPVQRALLPGTHTIEVESVRNGVAMWTTKEITIPSGERMELSLAEFLAGPDGSEASSAHHR